VIDPAERMQETLDAAARAESGVSGNRRRHDPHGKDPESGEESDPLRGRCRSSLNSDGARDDSGRVDLTQQAPTYYSSS
jgi:hypothetical protein